MIPKQNPMSTVDIALLSMIWWFPNRGTYVIWIQQVGIPHIRTPKEDPQLLETSTLTVAYVSHGPNSLYYMKPSSP